MSKTTGRILAWLLAFAVIASNLSYGAVDAAAADYTKDALFLGGGSNYTNGSWVNLPSQLIVGQDQLTISVWLSHSMTINDYAAMSFGTQTKHTTAQSANPSNLNMPMNYWILNPTKNGKFKSIMTKGPYPDADAPYNHETAPSNVATKRAWQMYTTVITEDSITGYLDGVLVSQESHTLPVSEYGDDLNFYIGRSGYNDPLYAGGVRNLKIYNQALTAEEIGTLYESENPNVVKPATTAVKQATAYELSETEATIEAGESHPLPTATVTMNDHSEIENVKLRWT